ncbi:MAG: aminopeptidase [Deltaproteobacteria bacterium]|nr:aminopeptidase [Deltaproteobacteria bacterium]
MSAHDALLDTPKDPSLMPGARNALAKALGLQPGQSFVLMAESGYEDVASAMLRAATELGLHTRTFMVDRETCERELFVERIVGELEESDGSALVASRTGLPPRFRQAIVAIRGQRRHAHMVGVTLSMMRQSMRADYGEMHALGERLIERLSTAREIVVNSGVNEQLVLRPDPSHRWYNGSGLLRTPGFTNLPAGEVSTCPASVDGSIRPDGGVWLPKGPVRDPRTSLSFREGRVVGIQGAERDEILKLLSTDENGPRVGQMCFGTNINVLTPIGAMLQDSKIPGFHLILGYSCPEHTGAKWNSQVMVPMLVRRADVVVDGKPLLVRGRYAREILG